MLNQPLVAVSACLLGQKVRYDGKDKYTSLIAEELGKYCRLLAVCPEVEIGLGVPRPKIQLTQVGSHIKVLQAGDPSIDVTGLLVDFAKQFVNQHALSGLVLQDKSPSCGIDNSKLFSEAGELTGNSSGLFAATMMDSFPNLLVVQASQLQSKADVLHFVKRLSKNIY